MSHAAVITDIGKKLDEGQLWAEVALVTNLGSNEGVAQYILIHMRPFLLSVIFPSVTFLQLKR